MYTSDIIRMSRAINQVDDDVVGGVPAGADSTVSAVSGQLGKQIWLDPSQIIFTTSVGTLYGGGYRYVRYRSADTPAPIVGQIAFWDTTVTDWEETYQVTREEDLGGGSNAIFIAGIFISAAVAGNYCYIQDAGLVPVRFRAALTSAGAVGSRCYAAGAGDGADEGYADVINTADPATYGDVSLLQARYLGVAPAAPVAGALANVVLGFKNIIG